MDGELILPDWYLALPEPTRRNIELYFAEKQAARSRLGSRESIEIYASGGWGQRFAKSVSLIKGDRSGHQPITTLFASNGNNILDSVAGASQ